MAKYHGIIGFVEQYESKPGVWKDRVTEREYYGDVLSASFSSRSETEVNSDFKLNDRISIVANTYAIENLRFMRYITYMGVKWKITGIDPQYPRLVLSIGGEWNHAKQDS